MSSGQELIIIHCYEFVHHIKSLWNILKFVIADKMCYGSKGMNTSKGILNMSLKPLKKRLNSFMPFHFKAVDKLLHEYFF